MRPPKLNRVYKTFRETSDILKLNSLQTEFEKYNHSKRSIVNVIIVIAIKGTTPADTNSKKNITAMQLRITVMNFKRIIKS